MKKWILIGACIWMGICCAWAQQTNSELIQKMNQKIAAAPCLEMDFEFQATNGQTGELLFDYSGTCFMQGDSYKITGSLYEIYSDTVKKYIFDVTNQELMVFSETHQENDITENPFYILKRVDALFKYRKNAESKKTEGYYQVELEPLSKESPYRKIILEIQPETYYPKSIRYFLENKDVYHAQLLQIRESASRPASFYRFDIDAADENVLITYGE